MNLKRENITLAENGDMWIKNYRQKTNIPSIIPVMDIAKSIIKKYENQNDSYVLPRSPHQHVNAYLKQIASSLRHQKEYDFHMARHCAYCIFGRVNLNGMQNWILGLVTI